MALTRDFLKSKTSSESSECQKAIHFLFWFIVCWMVIFSKFFLKILINAYRFENGKSASRWNSRGRGGERNPSRFEKLKKKELQIENFYAPPPPTPKFHSHNRALGLGVKGKIYFGKCPPPNAPWDGRIHDMYRCVSLTRIISICDLLSRSGTWYVDTSIFFSQIPRTIPLIAIFSPKLKILKRTAWWLVSSIWWC